MDSLGSRVHGRRETRTNWLGGVSCLFVFSFVSSGELAAQSSVWALRAGVAYAVPDGSFRAQRANGKVVTSDIEPGPLFALRVERRLSPRLGITAGLLSSRHAFVIHQNFPDGTEFEARDEFRFRAVTAGIAIHLFEDRFARLILEPFFLFAWYDNVSLESAGPPFDRTEPIDVDVEPRPGIGLLASLELPLGRTETVTVSPWLGVAGVRFSGPFPDDPTIPGSGGEIGVGFSPLVAGVALSIHF